MASAFASAHTHGSFDAIFEPSLTGGPHKVIWEAEAVLSEERFVGAFPLANAGVDDGFPLQELSDFSSAVSTEPGVSSSRLKHTSVRFYRPGLS
jgi:hypothetical protein